MLHKGLMDEVKIKTKIQSNGKEILLQVGSAQILIKNGKIILQGKIEIKA